MRSLPDERPRVCRYAMMQINKETKSVRMVIRAAFQVRLLDFCRDVVRLVVGWLVARVHTRAG